MSARIAPDPVGSAVAATADFRPRTTAGDRQPVAEAGAREAPGAATSEHPPLAPPLADTLPPLPPPPDPPGAMFAAAVMAGALSPRPETPREILMRLGSAWSPPSSSLHLADRLI